MYKYASSSIRKRKKQLKRKRLGKMSFEPRMEDRLTAGLDLSMSIRYIYAVSALAMHSAHTQALSDFLSI